MAAITFCGCSVTGFNSRLGWGSNKSSLDVSVVEDARNGDFFNPPALGTPCYFYFGNSFYFWGLLQNWVKNNSTQGLGLYNLTVEDPRELLAGTQLITSSYNGSTFNVPNILNCFGYWENTLGFGGADANEGGMPWNKIASAVQLLTNSLSQGDLGGPLSFRGIRYAVDLSRLPVPPAYYRVSGGPTMSLLSAIQQVCEDGGCDFFVELDPGIVCPIIRVYTVSRYTQPPLGTIAAITNQNWAGTVISSNNGVELRNAPTTQFLIGGEQNTLYQTAALQPFWGYDQNGFPVDNLIVNIPGLGYCNAAWVDASEISDCFNSNLSDKLNASYFLTEFEMRAAMDVPDGTWEQYVVFESGVLHSNKAASIGPLGVMSALQQAKPNAPVLPDFVKALIGVGDTPSQEVKQQMVKNWVKNIANMWYGKKYWASLPFVASYQDAETLQIRNSFEVSDGGYLPADQTPLGLYPENLLKFTQDDGRYEALAIFNPIGVDVGADESNPADSAWQPNGYYTKVSVDKSIYTWPQTGIPAVVVTINSPVKQELADIHQDYGMLGVCFQQDGKKMLSAFQGKRAFGTVHMEISAPRYQPFAVGIPLDSKISTYGPWYFAGPPGAVIVEQATDLTPWTYGGENFMNLAALAKVESAVTWMQVGEMGQLQVVGLPLCSLGRTLIAGGPETTNLEVHYGPEGIKTSYQFRTFTENHLNRFQNGMQERIRRLGRTSNEIKKSALLALAKSAVNKLVAAETKGARLKRYPKWMMSWSSPSPVFISSSVFDTNNQTVRTSTAICDATEGWTGIGASPQNDDELFQNSSMCSISAIVRAFSNSSSGVGYLLPRVVIPTGAGPTVNLSLQKLNPFRPGYNDIEYLSTGTSVSGTPSPAYAVGQNVDWGNVRGVCVSTPVMLAGWGYDIDGNFTPNTFFSPQYNVGPLDVLWDYNRGVWSVHDSMFGKLMNGSLPASGGTALMTITGSNNKKITVHNLFGSTVNSGAVICANFQPYLNFWAVIAADCP